MFAKDNETLHGYIPKVDQNRPDVLFLIDTTTRLSKSQFAFTTEVFRLVLPTVLDCSEFLTYFW